MEFVPVHKILLIRPDTALTVRKMYNLDKPESLEEAKRLLNEWIQKQPHFLKKDFHDDYLESTIVICKGSVERAKKHLDRLFTLRTLLPQFFGTFNCKTDFENLYEVVYSLLLPKLTDDHYRVLITKFFDVDFESYKTLFFHRHNIIMAEYVKRHDFLSGFLLVLDFTEANIMNILKNSNPVELRDALYLYIKGYGMKVKGIHIVSESSFVGGVVTLLKQVVSDKVAGRIKVHKSIEELYEFIPKAILPKDYGGDERSLKTLHEEWVDVLSSDEHLNYLEEINKAKTDESCRPKDQFLENYGGMPGTFRFLSVD